MCSHNCISAVEIIFSIVQMHRPAFSLGTASRLPNHFRHDFKRSVTSRDCMSMASIGCQQGILHCQSTLHSSNNCLLSIIQMAKSLYFSSFIQLIASDFNSTDRLHLLENMKQFLPIRCCFLWEILTRKQMSLCFRQCNFDCSFR